MATKVLIAVTTVVIHTDTRVQALLSKSSETTD